MCVAKVLLLRSEWRCGYEDFYLLRDKDSPPLGAKTMQVTMIDTCTLPYTKKVTQDTREIDGKEWYNNSVTYEPPEKVQALVTDGWKVVDTQHSLDSPPKVTLEHRELVNVLYMEFDDPKALSKFLTDWSMTIHEGTSVLGMECDYEFDLVVS